jgi:hypothetical protein
MHKNHKMRKKSGKERKKEEKEGNQKGIRINHHNKKESQSSFLPLSKVINATITC